MKHEHIEQAVLGLGRGVVDEAVVVGSGAVKLALPEFREPNDIDVAVSEDFFGYLQGQPGWQEALGQDGARLLRKDDFDIGIGWGHHTRFEDLQAHSWRTETGVQVAGLPYVYAYKQKRGSVADVSDIDSIRTRLQDPAQSPLEANVIPHEVAAAKACLSPELQDDPDAQAAILLAANGLHIVYTVYGHPQIGQANQIVGDLEQHDFRVPATYHNGFNLLHDAQRLQEHLSNIQAPSRDRQLALATDPYTDAIYGNGRFSDNPGGHDELRSAELLKSHALQLGFSEAEASRMHAAVLAGTFDESTGSQRGKASADPMARAVVAVDLQILAEAGSVEAGIDLAVEDGFSARYNAARTIGRVLCEHDEHVYTTATALELIDRFADEKPVDAPDGPTVMQAFAGRLAGNAGFHRSYQCPSDWTLDNPAMRQANANQFAELSAQLQANEITAVEAYQIAKSQ